MKNKKCKYCKNKKSLLCVYCIWFYLQEHNKSDLKDYFELEKEI